jgi:hypothetical protein
MQAGQIVDPSNCAAVRVRILPSIGIFILRLFAFPQNYDHSKQTDLFFDQILA